jgi:hypothetical protein
LPPFRMISARFRLLSANGRVPWLPEARPISVFVMCVL